MLITSPVNAQLKRARRVRDGREPEVIFIEGERLCEECLRAELPLVAAFYGSAPTPRTQAIIEEVERRRCSLYESPAAVLETVSDTVHSQGIIILAERPRWDWGKLLASITSQAAGAALLVGLDAVQDPGNVGTIIRTAEGAGAQGLIALSGTVDIFAPKTLRGAMGSAFRLPVVAAETEELIAACRAAQIKLVATAGDGQTIYSDYDWRQPTLVILGNEANGISAGLMAQCDVRLRIPLRPPVNSLNVAAAGSVLLFEAARQRSQP